MESKLAIAQRANKKARVRAIHAKIKNARQDAMHQFSRSLVDNYGFIFVGDVNTQSQIASNRSKSVLDAGWGMFKTMLQYKCHEAGVWFTEVDEAYTTQICSTCGELPESRPKGIADLGIREWTCNECGTHHDRDINAARNILAVGRDRLDGGITFSSGR
jgi:IS605 OrfB family transposase